MAFFRVFSSTIIFVAALWVVNATQVPIPYAAALVDNSLESTQSQDSLEAAPSGTYLQHYDSGNGGYRVQSGFDGYIIPAMAGAMLAQASENSVSTVASSVYNYMQPLVKMSASVLPKVGIAVVSVVALLAVGLVLALLFCAHTSMCHMTLMGFDISKESMRTFVSNDRISEVAHFLQTAIKKYQDMKKVEAGTFETNEVK